MSGILNTQYVPVVSRLALGVELWDVARGRRATAPLEVRGPEGLLRHDSGLLALTHRDDLSSPVELHVSDPARKFVPRRLSVPIAELDDVLAAEEAGDQIPVARRSRRIALFPGAAYDVPARTTTLRGSVAHDGDPVQWARVEARLPGDGGPRWRAHGDDRGEFLLVVGPDDNTGDLDTLGGGNDTPVIRIEVTVIGRDPAAPRGDPPLEQASALGLPDPVSGGQQLPAGYEPGVREDRDLTLVLGRQTSDPDPFEPN
jgi:hypothetical protein